MRKCAEQIAMSAAALALSACAQLTTGAETAAQLPRTAVEGTFGFFETLFAREELSVEVVEVGRLANCNTTGREPSLEMFADAAAVKSWQETRGVVFTPSGAEPPPGLYALAEMGERSTGGYSLAVSRQAAIRDDVLYLKGSFLVPGNASMVTEVLTSPCSLVRVPTRGYNRVVLLDQSNKVRSSWSAPGFKN